MNVKHLAAIALFGVSAANVASATIMLDSANADCSANVHPSGQPLVEAAFQVACATGSVTKLYTSSFGAAALGVDEGSFAGSYNTTFGGFEDPLDSPTTALIQYVLGQPAISGLESVFLLAKGGNSSPTYYGWDITGWNGMEDLSVVAWDDIKGSISNLTIWGKGNVSVPEPGTIGLLGLGLLGIGLMRRKRVR